MAERDQGPEKRSGWESVAANIVLLIAGVALVGFGAEAASHILHDL